MCEEAQSYSLTHSTDDKSVRLHVKKIVESCDRVKKLEEKVEKLQEDVEKLKQQIGQITPEKPKGQ